MATNRTRREVQVGDRLESGRSFGRGVVLAPAMLPPYPEFGHPEMYYSRLVRIAEQADDSLRRDSAKVGQYVTLALNPHINWLQKLRFIEHALQRHCVPPEWPDESVWIYYQTLANLVREQAGQEVLRLASAEDDLYATRLGLGASRDRIENDAEAFFTVLVPSPKPEWLNEADYRQLVMIRDQWI